jgi:hypothetical protein
MLEWVREGLLDTITTRQLLNINVTRDFLVGSGNHSSNPDLVQVMRFRWTARNHIMLVECQKAMFHDAKEVQEITDATASHDVFRQRVSPLENTADTITQWVGRLRESSTLVLRIIQAIRYGSWALSHFGGGLCPSLAARLSRRTPCPVTDGGLHRPLPCG